VSPLKPREMAEVSYSGCSKQCWSLRGKRVAANDQLQYANRSTSRGHFGVRDCRTTSAIHVYTTSARTSTIDLNALKSRFSV
jgi:hypothetical protein